MTFYHWNWFFSPGRDIPSPYRLPWLFYDSILTKRCSKCNDDDDGNNNNNNRSINSCVISVIMLCSYNVLWPLLSQLHGTKRCDLSIIMATIGCNPWFAFKPQHLTKLYINSQLTFEVRHHRVLHIEKKLCVLTAMIKCVRGCPT